MKKRFRQILIAVFLLYLIYLVKSALGINISDRYSAWGFIKLPIQPILDRHHG